MGVLLSGGRLSDRLKNTMVIAIDNHPGASGFYATSMVIAIVNPLLQGHLS